MTGSANDAVLGKHLEELSTSNKQYVLKEVLALSQAVAADFSILSGGSSSVAEFETALDGIFQSASTSAPEFDSALYSIFGTEE